MMNTEQCERCDGSGADPRQDYFDEVVALCRECQGDGVMVVFAEIFYEELKLSA
jgi:DnaJ-class molecular chaperone